MSTTKSKKLVPFYICEILKKYTDEKHSLSQKEIEEKLRKEYDVSVERKSVKRYIQDLIDAGVNICFTEKVRMVTDKKTGESEEQIMMTDIYLERDFCDGELRLLIDELRDSGFIPTRQKRDLIGKLEGLSGPDFHKGRAYTGAITDTNVSNELFYTLGVIEEAITAGRKVDFSYKKYVYGNDGMINYTLEEYSVIPCDTQVDGKNYFLICSEDGDSEFSLKMDLITSIRFSDEYAARAGHVSCRSTVVFETGPDMVSAFAEEFGKDNIRVEVCGDVLKLSVLTDESFAENFALKHSAEVTVLAPESCRRKVSEILKAGYERYGGCAS